MMSFCVVELLIFHQYNEEYNINIYVNILYCNNHYLLYKYMIITSLNTKAILRSQSICV